MFFSDPVSLWFRRNSSDQESDKDSLAQPSIDGGLFPESVNENPITTEDALDSVRREEVESSANNMMVSYSQHTSSSSSPTMPSSHTTSSSLIVSSTTSVSHQSRKTLKEAKKAEVKLGRSVSICVPQSSTFTSFGLRQLTLLPQILVSGDCPHLWERSLSSHCDVQSNVKSSPFSRRRRVSSPAGRLPSSPIGFPDPQTHPVRLGSLREEWAVVNGCQTQGHRSRPVWSGTTTPEASPDWSRNSQRTVADELQSDTEVSDDDTEADIQQCHNLSCTTRSTAIRVCHHPQCTEDNGGLPLLLCRQCDLDIHKNPEYTGHLVLDRRLKKSSAPAPSSSPPVDYPEDDVINGQSAGPEDSVDGVYVKHNSQTSFRGKIPKTDLERKLNRKKALKKKGKNELDAALDQIADPEGCGESTFYIQDCEDHRLTIEAGDTPSLVSQDSLELTSEDLQSLDYTNGSLNKTVPVRRTSRVSVSGGHFTLKFGMLEGGREDLEVVAALPQTTLREVIQGPLQRRSLDLNSVNVFVEKSHTPLPLTSDPVFLVGNVLEIKEKDTDPSSQSKSKAPAGKSDRKGSKQSGGSLRGRSRSGNLSVDDTFYPVGSSGGSWSESKRGKSPRLSVVNLFAPTSKEKDKEKLDQLTEILNGYSQHGLPPFPELLSLGRPKFDESIFEMEATWQSIVANSQNMTKKQQEHQEAVWELLVTEVSYIKQIRVIIDVFQSCLMNVQQESFLNEIESERLFSNIDKVFECNCTFWQQYLVPVLESGRENRLPLDPLLSKQGFVDHFPSVFQVYFKYFIEHKSCLEYAKACTESSDLFKIFIQWAEAQKQCNRLKLADILVKPMQRLLKYSLLLQAIWKHTENEKDRADISEMIQSVDKLCLAADYSLKRREDYEKLEAVRKTIEIYDSMEAPNDECAKIIQEFFKNFNLLAPMPGIKEGPRSLLFQSSLRMREAQNVKLDVDCLLFTDLVLICKSNKRTERYKMIRPPMRLDQLVVSDLKDNGSILLVYMNEYNVPISAFTFHSDVGAIRLWRDKLREAQRDYKFKRLQFENAASELANMAAHSIPADVEGNSAPFIPAYDDIAAFPRSESTESADHFLGNLTQSTTLAESSHPGGTTPGSLHLPHANTEPKLGSSSASDLSSSLSRQLSSKSFIEGRVKGEVVKHKPVQSSRSVPNITINNNNKNNSNSGSNSASSSTAKCVALTEGSHRTPSSEETPNNRTLLSGMTSSSIFNSHSIPENSLTEQNSLVDEAELISPKLNARRISRTEKRYRTADAIQDMKNSEKDSSIYKRLSWRTDVPSVDSKNLASRVASTDSVRSVPSSSGVSSTGSSHLAMDADMSEEHEGIHPNRNPHNSGFFYGIERAKHLSISGHEDLEDDNDEDHEYGTLSDSRQQKSKSTSDLVTMIGSLQVSPMEDGIASVEVSSDGITRKFTPADFAKILKHQILVDANIECSEV